jgi:hypothetical protein
LEYSLPRHLQRIDVWKRSNGPQRNSRWQKARVPGHKLSRGHPQVACRF